MGDGHHQSMSGITLVCQEKACIVPCGKVIYHDVALDKDL